MSGRAVAVRLVEDRRAAGLRLLLGAGVLAALGLTAWPAPAHARDRVAYGGARVGYLRVQDVDEGSVNLGILWGVYYAPRMAFDASVDYHTADTDAYGRETYALQGSAYVYPFTAHHAFRPYGVAGAGYYWNYYEPRDSAVIEDSRSDAGFHAGFGFDFFLGKQAASPGPPDTPVLLTIDFRYLFTSDDPGGTESDGLLATVGIKFGF